MKVSLLTYTQEPERTVAAAARLCYSPVGVEEILEKMDEERQKNFIKKLWDLNHLSPFEHVSFTFGIEGVSRALTHQLVRHRIASFSQQSQRYVVEQNFNFLIPPTIANSSQALEIYQQVLRAIKGGYLKLIEMGIPAEDARYLLPNAAETKIVVTMNARELLHFFEVRLCSRAQHEIRTLARKMLEEVRKVAPILFEKAGPLCETRGVCFEGPMSCGRLNLQNEGGS
ncbi:FAD-dependent thymidylate synthase [Carboxydothermus ferrireducens]|uniref:Flavin-dependent thymidylate synthase n=1 Tax=Carboxydothermus ferrireducens DSM 11255 TaxID=1119529 RepID=A0ABX2RBE6_9THEO|nr:FAD-dependent thymidylate synthase [Carboxydothermus ferrireducens]NYE57922.1 thymidylate synthase (FAD) [Carboxydothermus ferrireducens DSM 11255]